MPDPKLVVVTGANSGIGKAMASEFAKRGLRVVMACRNLQSAQAVREQIVQQSGNNAVEVMQVDLAEPDSVAAFGRAFRERYQKLDLLMNNAGIYLEQLQRNSRGQEMMMAINHFGTFLVTRELLEPLKRAGNARIVTTASAAHLWGRIDPDNLDVTKFRAASRYGQSKLANILFTRALAQHVAAFNIMATCYHPGAVGTGFAQDAPGILNALMQIGKYILISSEKGADTGIFLALDDLSGAKSGEYYYKRKLGRSSRQARDSDLAERFWQATEKALAS